MASKAMQDREAQGAVWADEGDGYYSTSFFGTFAMLAYVALPDNHPDVDGDYDNAGDPEVNGGLTFGDGNVFGWDYGHYQNSNDVAGDIARALEHFRFRQRNYDGAPSETDTMGYASNDRAALRDAGRRHTL